MTQDCVFQSNFHLSTLSTKDSIKFYIQGKMNNTQVFQSAGK